MKCDNCGFEASESNAVSARILAVLKDPLFFVVCILTSAATIMSLANGDLPLINILISVFLWLTYAKARKDVVDIGQLRSISGALYAKYVLYYVAAGLVLVAGAVLAICVGVLGSSVGELWKEMPDSLAQILAILSSASSVVILVICAFAAAVMVVVNIFTNRYLHRFARSLYISLQQGVYAPECVKAAKILLFILAGCAACSGISALADNSFSGFAASAADGGSAAVAALLIRKYLEPEV